MTHAACVQDFGLLQSHVPHMAPEEAREWAKGARFLANALKRASWAGAGWTPRQASRPAGCLGEQSVAEPGLACGTMPACMRRGVVGKRRWVPRASLSWP